MVQESDKEEGKKKIVQKGKVKMPQVVLMLCLQLVVLLSDLMYYAVMSSLQIRLCSYLWYCRIYGILAVLRLQPLHLLSITALLPFAIQREGQTAARCFCSEVQVVFFFVLRFILGTMLVGINRPYPSQIIADW